MDPKNITINSSNYAIKILQFEFGLLFQPEKLALAHEMRVTQFYTLFWLSPINMKSPARRK